MIFSRKLCVGVIALTTGALSCAAQACKLGRGIVLVQKDIAPGLRYRLIEKFGPLRFCDFECGGSCRIGIDSKHVDEIFAQIRQDAETFTAIVQHLGLQTTGDFSIEQKIAVYRQYEELACGMTFEFQGRDYSFKLLGKNGLRIEGRIKRNGEITVTEEEAASLVCPK